MLVHLDDDRLAVDPHGFRLWAVGVDLLAVDVLLREKRKPLSDFRFSGGWRSVPSVVFRVTAVQTFGSFSLAAICASRTPVK